MQKYSESIAMDGGRTVEREGAFCRLYRVPDQ